MPVNARAQVLGAGDAIRSLRKIDPALRKEFTKEAKTIAAPIIDEAVRSYPPEMLSGMARSWVSRGRQLFPYDRTKAVRGLTVRVDAGRKAKTVIKIVQKNPAAAIAEVAGNKLGRHLTQRFGNTGRFLWRAADRRLPEVQREMEALVMDTIRKVNTELR